ncbi:hypothetical protein [[Clostridium] hylemonae]|nr:hypothetical protein [[Clostridium] hylemonae]
MERESFSSVVGLLKEKPLEQKSPHVDETPVQVLFEEGRRKAPV